MKVKAKTNDDREISAMDDLLPSLHTEGLLTDIECRILVCARQLSEKQLALYRIMITKNKQTAGQLVEVFRAMTYGLHAEEEVKLQKSGCKSGKNEFDSPLQGNKNPMLNNTVIRCVFGFLPLGDIKKCRLVSRKWNSTAEILLRKRAKIHFRPDGLRPDTFLAVSKLSLPDLPFSAFKFSDCEKIGIDWREAELEDCFEKWSKNIKELNLDNIIIKCGKNSSEWLYNYDVTPWLEKTSTITSLEIDCSKEEYDDEDGQMSQLYTPLSLGKLETFSEIKTFILKGTNIITTGSKKEIRTAPVNIELRNITCERDDEIMEQFCYNDFFDFSQAVNIRLSNCLKNMSEVTFDMSDQVFKNTDLLYLNEITVKNWGTAQGTVRHVKLMSTPFPENNQLEIQSLEISDSEIDLFALPQTIERIEVEYCDISCSHQLTLPKLKYLKLHLTTTVLNQLTRFRLENCENLKELELELDLYNNGVEDTSLTRLFDVRSLPINLQTLRIKGNLQKYVADEDRILQIPGILVLDDEFKSLFSDYKRIAEKFRAGTLILVCHEYMNVITDDIVQFLFHNLKGEPKRIIIGMKQEYDDLHAETPFDGSLFSSIVDAESNYYEFENLFGIVGKAITRDQFLNSCTSVGIESIPFFLKKE